MSNSEKPNTLKIILFVILVALIAGGGFLLYNNTKRANKDAAISLQQEQQKWQEKVNTLERGIPPKEEETAAGQGQPGAVQPETAIEAEGQMAPGENIIIDPCRQTTDRIDAFFSRLDQEDYIIDFNLEGGSKKYFTSIIIKLLANKPNITRETDNLLSILQNAAHFYRVLGEKNIFILKKIMALEKGQLEPVMSDFYILFLQGQGEECRSMNYPIHMPLEDMYSYSTYFLNTLGGQAYLFRRDPTFRSLFKYYCVLVMDQANMQNANPLGVDIRYPLNSLIEELSSTTGLEDKDKYLKNLLEMKKKYEKLYGT